MRWKNLKEEKYQIFMAMPTLKMRRSNFYVSFAKRAGDLLVSSLLLVLLAPLLMILALVLFLHHRRNPIFIQPRIGKDGQLFKLIKFRTFPSGENESSISGLGKIFRSLSIDELPQLFNILMGQMSFVGPRPLLPEYLGYYSDQQHRRHEVIPGLTGLAQVTLGNSPDWKRRLGYDVKYVDHISFVLDISILFKTVIVLSKFREKAQLDGKAERFDTYSKRIRGKSGL